MPRNSRIVFLSLFLPVMVGSCSLPQETPAPTIALPSTTQSVVQPSTTNTMQLILPSLTPSLTLPTGSPTSFTPSATSKSPGIIPGLPSGPYAVILVGSADVLNLRTGPGVAYPINASFPATATSVFRTGPSAVMEDDLWVEVNKPGGGTGWVNSNFLTEYVDPTAFCGITSINTLIDSLDSALTTRNGVLLSSLTSPAHGVTIYLWRYGKGITYMQKDARWIFDSTYQHNWGSSPASGMDSIGSFQLEVLPKLQEVFNASYTLTCNSLGSAPSYGGEPWPVLYTNVNYYTVWKPGTPGIDIDFRFFLVGVEFVAGQPYIFSLIHFAWEP